MIRKSRLIAMMMTLCMLLSCAGCNDSNDSTDRGISRTGFLFDTVVCVTLFDSQQESLLDDCFSLLEEYEGVLSSRDEKSELYKLNHSDDTDIEISHTLYEVIDSELQVSRKVSGAFDLTIDPVSSLYVFDDNFAAPAEDVIDDALQYVDYTKISLEEDRNTGVYILHRESPQIRIDLGAAAKGYIADKCGELLKERGVESALIDLGGNILCVGGKKQEGEQLGDFNIGIYDPIKRDGSSITSVRARDLSVVTSGTYQRCAVYNSKEYHHILNPFTGMPLESNLVSVTIAGRSSLTCDILSTAFFLIGYENALNWNFMQDDISAMFIYKGGEIKYLGNFESLLTNA